MALFTGMLVMMLVFGIMVVGCDTDDALTIVIDNQSSRNVGYTLQFAGSDPKTGTIAAGRKSSTNHWTTASTYSIRFDGYVSVNGTYALWGFITANNQPVEKGTHTYTITD